MHLRLHLCVLLHELRHLLLLHLNLHPQHLLQLPLRLIRAVLRRALFLKLVVPLTHRIGGRGVCGTEAERGLTKADSRRLVESLAPHARRKCRLRRLPGVPAAVLQTILEPIGGPHHMRLCEARLLGDVALAHERLVQVQLVRCVKVVQRVCERARAARVRASELGCGRGRSRGGCRLVCGRWGGPGRRLLRSGPRLVLLVARCLFQVALVAARALCPARRLRQIAEVFLVHVADAPAGLMVEARVEVELIGAGVGL
mmetsp:Transcript_27572/g.70275  ORF Transcript_27572/g.70275 Transcript_27572/m.70275 type:complete len:257 (-) Transcript_27572:306-1076(-)